MTIKKQTLIFCFILSINHLFSCGNKEIVSLTINAKKYANRTVKINSPYFLDSIVLDNEGFGKGKFTMPNETFAFITIPNGNNSFANVMLFRKGYNTNLIIDEDTVIFDGKGKEANTVFLKCEKFWDQANSEINAFTNKSNSTDSIIDYYKLKDEEFEKFYSKIKLEYELNKYEDYIIKSNFTAKSLSKKQEFEKLYFSYHDADSLQIDQKFGFINHPLFNDTILLKAGSADMMNFLSWNFDFKISHDLSFKELGEKRYNLAVDSIISNNENYGWRVKEYLHYHNISSAIYHFGVTNEVDILLYQFNKKFPSSHYNNWLTKLRNKFDQLAPGKLAPDFSVQSKNGDTLKLSDLKGKAIFVDVWATWCVPCIKKIPTIIKYQKEFNNISFVFISIDNDYNKWGEFLSTHPDLNKLENYISGKSNFETTYRITSIPRYILIDEKGIVVNAFISHEESNIYDYLKKYSK